MKKRLLFGVMTMFFILGTAGAGFAATIKCTVDAVEGEKVTMTCEDADKLKAEDKLKVTLPKKGAALEGC